MQTSYHKGIMKMYRTEGSKKANPIKPNFKIPKTHQSTGKKKRVPGTNGEMMDAHLLMAGVNAQKTEYKIESASATTEIRDTNDEIQKTAALLNKSQERIHLSSLF